MHVELPALLAVLELERDQHEDAEDDAEDGEHRQAEGRPTPSPKVGSDAPTVPFVAVRFTWSSTTDAFDVGFGGGTHRIPRGVDGARRVGAAPPLTRRL